MKVRIVCYEDVDRWILGKFALKMSENLIKLGHDVDIAKIPDSNADINHHIIYGGYGSIVSSIDTLMITHIDASYKVAQLKEHMNKAQMGICMSRETVINLVNLGIPASKLTYINPAHDGIIKPRKLIVGITCRVQHDGRKREFMLGELAKKLNPNDFSFKIMGEYWDPYVDILKDKGFLVEYYNKFNYDIYKEIIPSLDYYLYFGQDEGQMGFIDALAAGVKTIVTPQGYHLDANGGITYPFTTLYDLFEVFDKIVDERQKLTHSISTWNWMDYTKKHLDIWEYLISLKNGDKKHYIKEKGYLDGIMSIYEFNNIDYNLTFNKKIRLKANLIKERFRHSYYIRKNSNRGI